MFLISKIMLLGLFYLFVLCQSSIAIAAGKQIKSMCVFGDSLSDVGNTAHLLSSLQQEESPSFLVRPLKIYVINKMRKFAADLMIPLIILEPSVDIVTNFFDHGAAPFLATVVNPIRLLPILPGPPYWQWRFSNGRVWNEYLATMLDVDQEDWKSYDNQAFGASWAATYDYQLSLWNVINRPITTIKTLIVGKLIPPSLGLTVQAYLMMHEKLNKDTSYFIFSGANDYLNALVFDDNYVPDRMNAYINNIVKDIKNNIDKLIAAGAKQLIIFGIPDVGLSPKYLFTAEQSILSAAVVQHNKKLKTLVKQLRLEAPDTNFIFIDTQKILRNVVENPRNYGFHNTTRACIDIKFDFFDHTIPSTPFINNYVLRYAQTLQATNDKNFSDQNYYTCHNPENYLFWDELHPTTRAHHWLAYAICKELKYHGIKATCKQPVPI